MTLAGKKILLGITGSIAAYKSALLCRLLIKCGAEVKVVMTPSATQFITPLTLETLSMNQVHVNVQTNHSWNNHVELGMWADLILIAPATANTIAHIAQGFCENLLHAVVLSAKCPIIIVPAMDLDMWKNDISQSNISSLKKRGIQLISVNYGFLASGLIGDGRMAEPEEILNQIEHFFQTTLDLNGTNVLITLGPTFESIDPVRFVGNRSTGKMGFAMAKACSDRGANVTCVVGPVQIDEQYKNTTFLHVESAQEMYETTKKHHAQNNIIIFAAAVADYTPIKVADQKIKSNEENIKLELKKTIDIAESLGLEKSINQIHIGFALETTNEEENALKKLYKKNFDLMILNSLNDREAGFGFDTNLITMYNIDGKILKTDLLSKNEIANIICNQIVQLFINKKID